MFKKMGVTLAIILVLLLVIAAIIFIKKPGKQPQNPSANPTNVSQTQLTDKPTPTGETSTSGYNTDWILVRDPKKISLHSNLEEKLSTNDAIQKYSCTDLISGGFFGQDNKQLGLFVSDYKKISDLSYSSLLNAFFSVDSKGTPLIAETTPDVSKSRFAIQSGPLILIDNELIKIKSNDNTAARRIVVAITKKNEVVFIAFYKKSSPLSGPKLEELPELLSEIQSGTSLKFVSAVNLDGGAHSAFITSDVKIPEISSPGSFFCISS